MPGSHWSWWLSVSWPSFFSPGSGELPRQEGRRACRSRPRSNRSITSWSDPGAGTGSPAPRRRARASRRLGDGGVRTLCDRRGIVRKRQRGAREQLARDEGERRDAEGQRGRRDRVPAARHPESTRNVLDVHRVPHGPILSFATVRNGMSTTLWNNLELDGVLPGSKIFYCAYTFTQTGFRQRME